MARVAKNKASKTDSTGKSDSLDFAENFSQGGELKEPQVPKEVQEAKVPKEAQMPKVPKEPKEPQMPKVPKEPKEAQMPKMPQEPQEPGVPFEEALFKLERIVRELEAGELALETSLEKFAEGISLSKTCLHKLNSAQAKIDKILREEAGELILTPLKMQEGGVE